MNTNDMFLFKPFNCLISHEYTIGCNNKDDYNLTAHIDFPHYIKEILRGENIMFRSDGNSWKFDKRCIDSNKKLTKEQSETVKNKITSDAEKHRNLWEGITINAADVWGRPSPLSYTYSESHSNGHPDLGGVVSLDDTVEVHNNIPSAVDNRNNHPVRESVTRATGSYGPVSVMGTRSALEYMHQEHIRNGVYADRNGRLHSVRYNQETGTMSTTGEPVDDNYRISGDQVYVMDVDSDRPAHVENRPSQEYVTRAFERDASLYEESFADTLRRAMHTNT